jgi:carboxyl-terminal processing protease
LAADRAGLKPGDRILLIDGVDVRALSSRELHLALAGEVDEVVKLTVLRGEEVLRVTVKRTAARRHVVSLPRLGPPAPAASSSAAPSGSVRLPGAEPPAF